ncbi:MAG: GDP-mannose 4,6-dehydratase, partial [Verrucomicrobiaceae bacterium]
KLGWEPMISAAEMCAEMVASDLEKARRHALLKLHGHQVSVGRE